MTSLDDLTNHGASNYDQEDNQGQLVSYLYYTITRDNSNKLISYIHTGSPVNVASKPFPVRVIIHGNRPHEEKKGAGKVIKLPGSVAELMDLAGT